MKQYVLKREQMIPLGREEVFAFFEKPENLASLTPAWLNFKILTPLPITMDKGRLIDYTIRVMGITQRWTSLITEFDPPNRFVDEQIKGPYSFWHHTHRFQNHGDETMITDEVKYGLPLGILGDLAHRLFVFGQLNEIFEYRQRKISEVLGKK